METTARGTHGSANMECIMLLQEQHNEKVFQYYNRPEIAAGYGQQEYITPCERLFFDAHIKPGMAVLDIGVGGGRTSPYLAGNASRYVGIDYAPAVLQICREKYPQWEYLKCSATDLAPFQNGSFDAVVIANTMECDLFPDENRWRCFQECHRVLREGGFLIFSSLNPRAILARQQESDGTGKRVLMAVRRSARRVFSYGTKAPFWRGEGYMMVNYGEKLITHFWTPKKAVAELGQCGFRFIALQGDDYPLKSHILMTHSYYYVFQKSLQSLTGGFGEVRNQSKEREV